MKNISPNFLKIFSASKKYIITFVCVALLVTVVEVFTYSYSEIKTDKSYQEYFDAHYKVMSLHIPKNMNFAGEPIPITDFSVREALDREFSINTYWQSQTLLMQKRANRWFTTIEPILKKNGIPDDFKYIAMAESQLTNVVSPQGATGFWQLIESTGKGYGLEINEEVDERYDVAKATEAACKYFNEAYKQFNNWTLVAASYNLGMTGVQAQIDRQKVKSYYDLLLNEETSRYIFRILSIKEIVSRPKVYGFIVRKKDLYPVIETKKIVIDSAIPYVADFAIEMGTTYKMFKIFNPWLRTNTLTNAAHKKYIVQIPINSSKIYDMDGNYNGSDTYNAGDSVRLSLLSEILADTTKQEVIKNE